MRRSGEVVQGSWWRTLGCLLMTGLLLGVTGRDRHDDPRRDRQRRALRRGRGSSSQAIAVAITAVFATLLFYDLRARHERRALAPAETMAAVIDRYTRAEIGALWTDEARMEAWRRRRGRRLRGDAGPDARRPRGDPRRHVHRRGRARSASAVTDHDVAAFVDVLSESAGPSGRWIHFGLTSSDVLDTALALQIRAAGEIVVAGARGLVARAGRARARARGDRLRRAHARRPGRADDVRHQARRLRVRGRAQRPAPAGARSPRRRSAR